MLRYSLRRATPQDASDLQRSCWQQWETDIIAEMLDRVEKFAAKGRGYAAVSVCDGQVIGYGQLLSWAKVVEISDLIVAPAYRNQGIGTALIHHLIGVAQGWGKTHIEIGAALRNTQALALYRRLGFGEDRLLHLELGNGLEPVVYLKMALDGDGKQNDDNTSASENAWLSTQSRRN